MIVNSFGMVQLTVPDVPYFKGLARVHFTSSNNGLNITIELVMPISY